MRGEFLIERGSGSVTEDQILVAENIFGVFDGATSLKKYADESGNTGGLLASSIARATFEKNDNSLLALATEANEKIHLAMQENGIDTTDKANLWTTTIAAIRISENAIEWLTLADSIIMVFDTKCEHRLLAPFRHHDVGVLKLWRDLAQRKLNKIGDQQEMKDVLLQNRCQANISYGALNGEPGFLNFVETGTSPLANIVHVVLATDGLFIPTEQPDDKGWDQFAALYLDGGLQRIRNFVRDRETSDVECWKYPRFKVHDDIGAIAVSFPRAA
jgi:hypothetical protein